jgi:amino acid transporter
VTNPFQATASSTIGARTSTTFLAPSTDLRTHPAGLDFGRAIAGPVGGIIFAVIVSISCLGALNGSLYTSSRLIVAAGEQGFLPKVFARYNERQSTPINGILLSSSLSALFIVFGDFAQ